MKFLPGSRQTRRFAAVIGVLVAFCLAASAQPDRADAVFAEAKTLAAAESVETRVTAVAKFDEAAELFKAAGNKTKVAAVELAHGRLLRVLAVIAMNAQMKADPTMNKAEAIRLAQRETIDGKLKASGKSAGCRAENFTDGGTKPDEFKCDPKAPYSHPYFWSPFVLIGNWR